MVFVAYDDGGGFYDHVVPPMNGVPNDESPCHTQHGCNHPFDFQRLGIRVTSFLISPWIPKNTAIRTPSGPEPTSQYDLTCECMRQPNHQAADSLSGVTSSHNRSESDTPLVGCHAQLASLRRRCSSI